MPSINKNTNTSLGGICLSKLQIIDAEENIELSDIINMEYADEVVLNGSTWEDFYFVEDTAQWSEESVERDGVEAYKTTIKGVVAYGDAERKAALFAMSRRQWIVKFKDNLGNNVEGEQRIVGENECGMAVRFGHESKAQRTQRNELSVEFTCILPYPSPTYPFD